MKFVCFLSIIACSILTSSCQSLIPKEEEPNEIQANLLRFVMNKDLDKNLHIKLYGNETDYYNDANVLQTIVIPASKQEVAVTLKNNTEYYYDLYSDDLTSTNWADRTVTNHSFRTDSRSKSIIVYNASPNCHRQLLLPSNQPQSKWVAVGSFTTMGSSWNSLSADEKNKSIIFRRDLTATFQDGSKSKLLYYGLTRPYISAINSYNISLFNVASQSDVDTKYGSGYITCKGPISPLYLSLKPNGANYETVLPITDTMYVTCDSFSKVMTLEQTFILVREK